MGIPRGAGYRWPADAAPGDYPVKCGICNAVWLRSEMRMDGANRLVCPDEGPGLDEVTLELMNADALAAAGGRPAVRRDGRPPRVPRDITEAGMEIAQHFDPTYGLVSADGALVSWRAAIGNRSAVPPASVGLSGVEMDVTEADDDFAGNASVSPGSSTARLLVQRPLFAAGDRPSVFIVGSLDSAWTAFSSLLAFDGCFAILLGGPNTISATLNPLGSGGVALGGEMADGRFILEAHYYSDGAALVVNGVTIDSSDEGGVYNGSGDGAAPIGIGNRPTTLSWPWDGRISEVLFAKAVTAEQAALARGILARKHGISL